jgi:hypothetical protein
MMPFWILDSIDIPIVSRDFIQANQSIISWGSETLSIMLSNVDASLHPQRKPSRRALKPFALEEQTLSAGPEEGNLQSKRN